MNIELTIFVVLFIIALILLVTIDLKLLVYSGNYYKCNIKINGSFTKSSDDVLVDGFERFDLIPYKDKHFIFNSKGYYLSHDGTNYSMNGYPVTIQNGIVYIQNQPLTTLDIRLLLPIAKIERLKKIADDLGAKM